MNKSATNRVLSIDIMRGLTLFLMLFVNDLYEPAVPSWLLHSAAEEDRMGLADWVFPGFLFMVGVAIPYAIQARKNKSEGQLQIIRHIFIRSLSLMAIGVLILNGSRVQAELTGMPSLLWLGILYICIFLIWNLYPADSKYEPLFRVLKALGLLGILYLLFIFKADEGAWIEIGWWGILGLIGWGYLISALIYTAIANRIALAALIWLFFIGLNILSALQLTAYFDFAKPLFSVLLSGNVPSIVLSGLCIGMLIKQYASQPQRLLSYMLCIGIVSLVFGFILRNWFILSKIYGTPSWAMVCNGISILVLALIYFVVDIKRYLKWAFPFQLAGKNSLTTYLAPDIIYFIIWGFSLPILLYKDASQSWIVILGSLVWALLMIAFSNLLLKINIRLKL